MPPGSNDSDRHLHVCVCLSTDHSSCASLCGICIALQDIVKASPALRSYYLGYYIHNCQKMRYKAEYCPSDLLCPVRYIWTPYQRAKALLDKSDGEMCVLSNALFPERETSGNEAEGIEGIQEVALAEMSAVRQGLACRENAMICFDAYWPVFRASNPF